MVFKNKIKWNKFTITVISPFRYGGNLFINSVEKKKVQGRSDWNSTGVKSKNNGVFMANELISVYSLKKSALLTNSHMNIKSITRFQNFPLFFLYYVSKTSHLLHF